MGWCTPRRPARVRPRRPGGPSGGGSERRTLRSRLTLRTRLVLVATGAVAVGIGAGAGVTYAAVSHELTGHLQSRLDGEATAVAAHVTVAPPTPAAPGGVPSLRRAGRDAQQADHDDDYYFQFVAANGSTVRPSGQLLAIPTGPSDRQVAAGRLGGVQRDVWTGVPDQAGGQRLHLRIATRPVASGWAVQIAAPLGDVDGELAAIRMVLLLAALGGVALAAALGALVARTTLRPVTRLTAAAERIAATQDLDHRITVRRNDELGRLARSLNTMLAAVRDAAQSQQRLVADASHELRTPLTGVRTNVEMLARGDRLDAADRAHALDAAISGLRELTDLVNDLVDLARGSEQVEDVEELRWDRLVAQAVARAQKHWPQVAFVTAVEPVVVAGARSRLDSMVRNLLDNGAKFSPPGAVVEVTVRGEERNAPPFAAVLTVRDHGPGIPAEDREHVFARFYRSRQAHGKPGSGLGLAIVRQVVDFHHGTVAAESAPGGGTVLTVVLPALVTTPGAARPGVTTSDTAPPHAPATEGSPGVRQTPSTSVTKIS